MGFHLSQTRCRLRLGPGIGANTKQGLLLAGNLFVPVAVGSVRSVSTLRRDIPARRSASGSASRISGGRHGGRGSAKGAWSLLSDEVEIKVPSDERGRIPAEVLIVLVVVWSERFCWACTNCVFFEFDQRRA